MDNGDRLERLILAALQRQPLLTIVEIAEKVNINRLTASKYLYSLETRGIVRYRAVGNAKLFYIVKPEKKVNILSGFTYSGTRHNMLLTFLFHYIRKTAVKV